MCSNGRPCRPRCASWRGAEDRDARAEVYSYDASRLVAYTVDLPVTGQVAQARPREPFLVFVLELDPYRIAELALKV